jgi:hypothetical protein
MKFHVKPPSALPHSAATFAARPILRHASFTAALALSLACSAPARAQSSASELSDLSLLPVAVSAALPVMLVAGVGSVVVQGVEVSADGVVWVVRSTVDGAVASVRVAGHAAGAVSVAVGTVITVTALAAGTLLCVAGEAIAFIPNEIGRAMLYHQKVSR